ncbi:MAG: NYN domain-containing protein [Cellulomonadaceae bacterium]|nr:NYN domain-containing protein [Cellulomonadaceae bacterium]
MTVQASQTSTPEDATPPITGNRPTYLLVDGENIDATLGMSVLGRRPNSEERPRWDRIRTFAQNVWGQPVIPLFFLNATSGHLPMGFVSALLAMGYKPIPLSGSGRSDEKVVDIGIQRTLNAIVQREGDVILASHDGDFIPQMEGLLTAEDRRVGVLVFREFLNARVAEIGDGRIEVFDLEQDAGAFTTMLPRVRIIPLDEFDPARYL